MPKSSHIITSSAAINYGGNKVALHQPRRSGRLEGAPARARHLMAADPMDGGGCGSPIRFTVEIEGAERPRPSPETPVPIVYAP